MSKVSNYVKALNGTANVADDELKEQFSKVTHYSNSVPTVVFDLICCRASDWSHVGRALSDLYFLGFGV